MALPSPTGSGAGGEGPTHPNPPPNPVHPVHPCRNRPPLPTDDTLPLRPPIPNPYSESRQAIRPELAILAGNANNKAHTVSGRQRPSRLSSRMAVRRLHPPYSTGIRQTAQRESPPPRAALPRFHQPVARGTRKPRTNLSARKNSVGAVLRHRPETATPDTITPATTHLAKEKPNHKIEPPYHRTPTLTACPII